MEQVTTLCEVLGEETRVCELLVDTLRREQRAVVEVRPEAVVACLAERHELGSALAGVAARRRAAAAALGDALDARGLPASALLPLLPPEPRAHVRTRLRTVRRVLTEARGLERQNALLASASLGTVNEILAALRAAVPGARYGADARLDAPLLPERVDRRA